MPCYMTGSLEGDLAMHAEDAQEEAQEATRAACELLKYLRDCHVGFSVPSLTKATQRWIRKHEKIDRKRKER